jgi:hypothetical protein
MTSLPPRRGSTEMSPVLVMPPLKGAAPSPGNSEIRGVSLSDCEWLREFENESANQHSAPLKASLLLPATPASAVAVTAYGPELAGEITPMTSFLPDKGRNVLTLVL